MKFSDFTLLGKKIGVGILITVVPLGILAGGLWASQKAFKKNQQPTASHSLEVSNAN